MYTMKASKDINSDILNVRLFVFKRKTNLLLERSSFDTVFIPNSEEPVSEILLFNFRKMH